VPEEIKKDVFPKNFMWGASTAAHQVEGDNHNQWSVWELMNAERLARGAPHKIPNSGAYHTFSELPIWPKAKKQATDPANYISGRGIEHYKRYKKDFDLVKELNLNAFRFTIEWSRIEPQPGQWDQAAIDHYKDYIKELKKREIEPILNIFHWTLPLWFAEMGGFEHKRNLKYFERFIHKVSQELMQGIHYVITLNEPNVYATFSYLTGEFPPQQKNLLTFMRVYYNLVRAHRRAYYLLKHAKPSLQVGVAAQLANIQAKRSHNFFDEVITKWMRYFWNWWFLRRVRHEQDFVGLNYYFTDYYEMIFPIIARDPKVPANDLGWYMEPEGIYPLLLRIWARYKKPIIITENGVADQDDQYRRWWIEETMVAMERALSEGVEIKGYFHWSLLDNFEWAQGWWPKFGLVEVDRKTMRRKVRPSAKWLAGQLAKLNEQ
jgi:beta-glucosidase